jgi:hypothetical protein
MVDRVAFGCPRVAILRDEAFVHGVPGKEGRRGGEEMEEIDEMKEMEEGREKKSIEKGRGENRLEGKEREIIKR